MGIHAFIHANADKYRRMAVLIQPDLSNWTQVWSRAAFAILSANTSFDLAVRALSYANKNKGACDPRAITKLAMTPDKAHWLNALPIGPTLLRQLTHGPGESDHTLRLRLRQDVTGMGMTKASFYVALLNPSSADVACIDTHMQQYYLGYASWQRISVEKYLKVESSIRRIARQHSISTFLAQWMIWDYRRGTTTDHAIFPGSHKR